jgi:pyruvate, orthophosphate dikinase
VVFSAEEAMMLRAQGGAAILVRGDTAPEDVGGMHASEGILTQRGGMTSHAAVVARGWGKTCVVGCMEMMVDDRSKSFTLGGKTFKAGDWISLNGNSGEVIDGKQSLSPPILVGDLSSFMSWVDEKRRMLVYANADTPEDAAEARRNGAQGIGLVRTEHMFYSSEERLKAVRTMIMADTSLQRTEALSKLLPYQRADFEGIFRAMGGCNVTIRLLDPPLHEFLPSGNMDDVCAMIATEHGISSEAVMDKLNRLSEVNPMLGFRGCRLGVVFPEISAMQARGIFEAALAAKAKGWVAVPNIMVPLVGCVKEFESQARVIRETAEAVFAEKGDRLEYKVGALVEIPRACLIAGQVAKSADFFSFGTNDLTQMTFGFSRDDMGTFLPTYLAQGILKRDPFQELDAEGVGELIKICIERARASNPNVVFGVSGEHGGDPASIHLFDSMGIDYVSCSPFRVPIARLSAAKAACAGAE